jgi:hypothetical protein
MRTACSMAADCTADVWCAACRFDKFNLKYNPFGQSRLREIFIKQVRSYVYVDAVWLVLQTQAWRRLVL